MQIIGTQPRGREQELVLAVGRENLRHKTPGKVVSSTIRRILAVMYGCLKKYVFKVLTTFWKKKNDKIKLKNINF